MLDENQKRGSIKLSLRCIWEKRYPLWGQLSYNIRTDKSIICTFTSIVWKNGDSRAYIMKPYLCFSGDQDKITYERLSRTDTLRIILIAGKTIVKDVIHWKIPKLYRLAKSNLNYFLTAPYRAYQRRQGEKAMKKFWDDMGTL